MYRNIEQILSNNKFKFKKKIIKKIPFKGSKLSYINVVQNFELKYNQNSMTF